MAKAFFIRTMHGLAPDGDGGLAALKGVKIGQTVAVEVTRPRNVQMLRLYWAMCGVIADSIGSESEDVSNVLKVRTGHVTTIKTSRGIERFPKSISFGKMSQQDFDAFFNKCVSIISTEWLGNMPDAEVKAQLEEMMGLNYYAANPRSHKRSAA